MNPLCTGRQGLLAALCVFATINAFAQDTAAAPAVHIVYMGGNDCPPCVNWRRFELPKLEQSEEFKSIRFSYVTKTIESHVPAAFFLPADVKPLKDKLDAASASGGSPQTAVLVNGEVFDYFHGTRSANDIVGMLAAIRSGTTYPFERCLKIRNRRCETRAEAR